MTTSSINRRDFLHASLGLSLAGSAGVLGSEPAALPEPIWRADPSWEKNEVIQQARRVALDILKPSQKDLQHGLELHADSLVFETYGFSPRAAE